MDESSVAELLHPSVDMGYGSTTMAKSLSFLGRCCLVGIGLLLTSPANPIYILLTLKRTIVQFSNTVASYLNSQQISQLLIRYMCFRQSLTSVPNASKKQALSGILPGRCRVFLFVIYMHRPSTIFIYVVCPS